MDILLLPITPEDFPKLIAWAESEEFLLQWTGRTFTYPLDEAQLQKYFDVSSGPKPLRKIFKAVDTDNGKHIGNITIDWASAQPDEAALTCIIVGDPDYKGKGVDEIIVNMAAGLTFSDFGRKKLYLNVFDFNHSAIKCYEKCGFKEMYRERLKLKGKDYVNVRMEKRLG